MVIFLVYLLIMFGCPFKELITTLAHLVPRDFSRLAHKPGKSPGNEVAPYRKLLFLYCSLFDRMSLNNFVKLGLNKVNFNQ